MRQFSPVFTPTVIAVLMLLQAPSSFAQTATQTPQTKVQVAPQSLTQQMDQLAASYYKANEPGATVIVTKEGKTIFRKAYGMSDMQAKRVMQPDDVMRLGSITKQFTAVAILMLVDEGKLALSDTVQSVFPDYPDTGKKITIEHLLTHTSGIPNFTSKPSFFAIMDKDISVSDMVASFKNDALEFEPGSAYNYSNSGYFLLGAIIEKISGDTYAKFVEKCLFLPLGMTHTAYEGYERTQYTQAAGHMSNADGFVASKVISMSVPYAAGSLRSSVDDLAKWDAAISAGKLLKPATWKRAFSDYVMSNGQTAHYGYGWSLGQLEASPVIAHGGGINGFSTYALRLPNEKVYVAVLTNSDSGIARPEVLASRLAASAIGKTIPEFTAIKLDEKALDQFAGVYKIDEKNRRSFVRDGDKLIMTRTDGPRTVLQAYAPNAFFIDRQSLLRVEFVRNAQGEVLDAIVHQNGTSVSHPRTTEALPVAPVTVKIAHQVFDRYVGKYQIAPNFILSVSRDGDRYLTQATGQDSVEITALSETTFLAASVPAQLRFDSDAEGKVMQVVLMQGGREVPAKRLP
ncbi:MAG: serine hydrolase [Burkholderiales bacterium]|nr:serine hydrolase [Burkholderiales bacterium]